MHRFGHLLLAVVVTHDIFRGSGFVRSVTSFGYPHCSSLNLLVFLALSRSYLHSMSTIEHLSQPSQPDPNTMSSDAAQMYDLVGIGFGPAQIAIAVASQESPQPSKILFLERKPSFPWHGGTHLARTRMENPFVYDLATIRNPRSAFTYVNYLLARKRLIEFANSDRLNPLRVEFEDYLRWCAEQFRDHVKYGSEVVEVVPILDGNTVTAWKIAVRDSNGDLSTVRARNVVAPSPEPSQASKQQQPPLPSVDFLAGQRIISTEEYLSKRNDLRGVNEPRLDIAVVGSGQKVAEIIDDLLSCPRLGDITLVTEDKSLAPLQILSEQQPPQPRLCSIWAKPSSVHQGSVTEASELIQSIYMRAYEKQVASKGQYGLRVVVGKDAAEGCSRANFIIRETAPGPMPSTQMLQSLDGLVLGCRSKGDGLEEVQFKRGVVVDGCRFFLVSAHTDGGRSLAKDVAVTAGRVVSAVSSVADGRQREVPVQARM
jgi:L-ornithine N5-oxygenase